MRIILNGCFDLFHDGHKHLITKALQWSDHGTVLILLNSDNSIKRLKGLDRPHNTYDVRKEQILALKSEWCLHNKKYPVFYIVKFNTEKELNKLIDNFEPDLIIKGNDRPDVRDIVGSDNWPVCIVPRLKDKNGDISTTRQLSGKE